MGVKMKQGEAILIPAALANLDNSVFENPTLLNLERQAKAHLSFGAGVHTCVGSRLARLELTIAIEEWLKRIPQFEIDDTEEIRSVTAATVGLSNLPLKW